MERRRCQNRKGQLEAVLSLFFFRIKRFNVMSVELPEGNQTSSAYITKDLESVNGAKVPYTALIGHGSGANPVENFPLFRTRPIISPQDIFLGLLFRAVNGLQGRIVSHLEKAELAEPDSWLREDLRLAQLVVLFADEDKADPYTFAFISAYGKHPSKVVGWWRDRKKLWNLAQGANCPTPLLAANQAQEFTELIPDYDYSQVSPVPSLPQANPAKKPAAPATTGSGDRGAGSPEKRTA